MLKLARAQSGFTIIEALVAIVLFGLLLGGVATLAVHSLQFSESYKNDLKAALFAQEGIELIRAARDTNRLNGDEWLNGITNLGGIPCRQAKGCYIQLDTTDGTATFQQCTGSTNLDFNTGASGCPALGYDSTLKLYYVGMGLEETSFKRSILVTDVTSGGHPALLVEVMVTWTTRFGEEKLLMQDTLTDWQQ